LLYLFNVVAVVVSNWSSLKSIMPSSFWILHYLKKKENAGEITGRAWVQILLQSNLRLKEENWVEIMSGNGNSIATND
jgi:hypothetical protein